jgi:eukaryotic-like serine/threonine-protein kinase
VAYLSPSELRQYHYRLATALEDSSQVDPEVLAVHFRGAEEFAKAGLYLAQAAEALAFDHAAKLYRLAIEYLPEGVDETRNLWVKLGNALANAGRGAEGAEAYLKPTEAAPADNCLQLRQCAATQYLISGHYQLSHKKIPPFGGARRQAVGAS